MENSEGLVGSVGVFALPENKMIKEEVQFNNFLIKNLVSDHKELLAELTLMMKSAENDEFFEANRLLSSFGTKLEKHFRLELVELYVYLNAASKMMTIEERESIKGFSDAMYKIEYTLKNLLDSYAKHPVSAANKGKFIEEFNVAANILANRIECEENILYPLYGRYGRTMGLVL
jgi:Hemerythrin HHE cation binding domain